MQSKRKIIVNQRKEQINVIKIILTDVEIKFNKAIDSSKHPQVRKGRVRENILNLLSQQPYSLTDLSRIIKVSKPTISYHLSDLLKNGIPEEKIRAIRSPVGLDLRGRSPDEIAVSIIAEMLMIKEGGTGLPMAMPEKVWSKIISKINNSLSESKI